MTVISSRTHQSVILRTQQYDITCELRKGFTIRVQPTGKVSYKYRYRDAGKQKLIALPETYEEALAEYETLVSSVVRQRGIIRYQASTDHSGDLFLHQGLDHLQKQWLKEHVKVTCSAQTIKNYTRFVRYLNEDTGDLIHNDISVTNARKLIRDVLLKRAKKAPVSSNRMYTALQAMFFYGMKHDLVSNNPLYQSIDKAKESPKSRMLNRDELSLLLPHLNQCEIEPSKVDALKLILMTGMRSGEVLGLKSYNINLADAQIHLSKTKNAHPFIVALPKLAVHLLRQRMDATQDGEPLFGGGIWGLSQASRRACKTLGITICSAHDYRRTCATMCGQEGVPVATISRILNHSEGRVGTTLKHYALYDMEKEKRAALELVAARLKKLGMRV